MQRFPARSHEDLGLPLKFGSYHHIVYSHSDGYTYLFGLVKTLGRRFQRSHLISLPRKQKVVCEKGKNLTFRLCLVTVNSLCKCYFETDRSIQMGYTSQFVGGLLCLLVRKLARQWRTSSREVYTTQKRHQDHKNPPSKQA